MKKTILILCAAILCVSQGSMAQGRPALENGSDSLSYIMGSIMGTSFLDEEEIKGYLDADKFCEAFKSVYVEGEEPMFSLSEAMEYYTEFTYRAKYEKRREQARLAKIFLEENARRRSVSVTPSGIQYEVLKKARGSKPQEGNAVRLNYTITSIHGDDWTGHEMDDTQTFSLSILDDGFVEAIMLMEEGSEYRFWLPYGLIYDEDDMDDEDYGEPIVFHVQLIEILESYEEPEPDWSYYDYDDEDDDDLLTTADLRFYSMVDAGDYTRDLGHLVTLGGYHGDGQTWKFGDVLSYIEGNRIKILDDGENEIANFDFPMHLKEFFPVMYTPLEGGYPRFLVLDAQVEYDYPYGALVYAFESPAVVKYAGVLNVSEKKYNYNLGSEYSEVNPALCLRNMDDGVNFIFIADELIYNPKGEEVRFPGYDIRYIYTNGQWTETGGATNLSYFGKRNLIEQLRNEYGLYGDHIITGDLNGDGYADAVFKSENSDMLHVALCRDYRIVEMLTFPLTEATDFYIDDSQGFLKEGTFEVDLVDEDSLWTVRYRINGKELEKVTDDN